MSWSDQAYRFSDFSGVRKYVFRRSWHFLTPVLNLDSCKQILIFSFSLIVTDLFRKRDVISFWPMTWSSWAGDSGKHSCSWKETQVKDKFSFFSSFLRLSGAWGYHSWVGSIGEVQVSEAGREKALQAPEMWGSSRDNQSWHYPSSAALTRRNRVSGLSVGCDF